MFATEPPMVKFPANVEKTITAVRIMMNQKLSKMQQVRIQKHIRLASCDRLLTLALDHCTW